MANTQRIESKPTILGISCHYHDSAATIIQEGQITAAAEEERFTRKKHDSNFPINAIKYCLNKTNNTINNIDYIAYYEKPITKFERILYQHLQHWPKSYKTFIQTLPHTLTQKIQIERTIRKQLGYKGPIHYHKHHQSHAASAYLPSKFTEAAILTIDGVGEWNTTTIGKGTQNKIKIIKEINFPHSIGLLYSTITALLGFSVNNSEYKVMGLAAYGNQNKKTNQYYKKLKKVYKQYNDSSFKLNLKYFQYQHTNKMPTTQLERLLNTKTRKQEPINQTHKDISAALQLHTEEIIIKLANHTHKITKSKNLCLAGGVALNSVANGKILSNTPFTNIWIQPASGDSGGAIGAAALTYSITTNTRIQPQTHSYYGPQYTNQDIKIYLDSNYINYTTFNTEKEQLQTTAKMLYNNKVIGWFQGPMEWGPRALGNRSILANPKNPKAQQLLNQKVKHREKFRPFAPVITEEDTLEYFEADNPTPEPTDYMLMVYPIRPIHHTKIPSVTHIDGSGRLQTIRKHQNPLYYQLIKEFETLSKTPILINTSFNIRGEPIVCTPHDAYKCMMGTEIDSLIIGKFLIHRNDNSKDKWNSEVDKND